MRIAVGALILFACGLGAVIAVKNAEIQELARLNEEITGELADASSEMRKAQKELQSKARQLRTAREQLDIANRTIDRLDARIAQVDIKSEAPELDEAEDEEEEEDPRAKVTRTFMKAMGEFLDNPEFKGMRENRQRAEFERNYAALFEILDLDAAMNEQVRALLLERQIAMADFGPRFMALAGNPDQLKALTEEMGEIRDKYDGDLRELLGADYAQLQEYETTIHDRESLARLSNRLERAGEPLDTETEDAMLQLMGEARRAAELDANWQDPRMIGTLMEPGAVDGMLEQVEAMQVDVYTRSEEILSESQREVLSRQQKIQGSMFKATMRAFAQ